MLAVFLLTSVSIVDHFQGIRQQIVVANHVHRRHMNGYRLKETNYPDYWSCSYILSQKSYPGGGDGNRRLGLSSTVTMMPSPAPLIGLGVAEDMSADS